MTLSTHQSRLILAVGIIIAIAIIAFVLMKSSTTQLGPSTTQVVETQTLVTQRMGAPLPQLPEGVQATSFIDNEQEPTVVGYVAPVESTYYHKAAREYVVASNKRQKIATITSLLADNPDLQFIQPPKQDTQLMEGFGAGPKRYMWHQDNMFYFLSFE